MIFVQFTLHKFERRKPAFQSQAHFRLLVSRPRNQNENAAYSATIRQAIGNAP